jgi:DNA modification methylase
MTARADKREDWDFAHLGIRDTQYLTHFFHHWTAKFIPQIPARLIERYSAPGEVVIDPFMGSGTTLVEAAIRGRPTAGTDINPLAHKIALAKTSPIDEGALALLLAWLEDKKAEEEPATGAGPALFSGGQAWFRPDVAAALSEILAKIRRLQRATRNFVEVGLSDLVKGVSNAMMDKTVPVLPPTPEYYDKKHDRVVNNATRRINVYQRLAAQLKHMDRALRDFLDRADGVACRPLLADARELSRHVPAAKLAITSPPYWDAQNYQKLHSLSFKLLGLPEPGRAEIGRSKQDYLADMEQAIAELRKVLLGHFALVIGEAKDGAHEAVRDLCLQHGMKLEETIKRRVINHAFFAKQVKEEYIFVFRSE